VYIFAEGVIVLIFVLKKLIHVFGRNLHADGACAFGK
jgi:hypothetical protein